MSTPDQNKVKLLLKVQIAKYADDVSEEDIANGTAVPYEVIESEEDLFATPEQVKELGLEVPKNAID